ncbi:MAG: hypothetical protein RML40_12150, partial [Bacteroidota bacterium]|nr:hypothetical protein [Candidatus Kapabacteria bacterium]MDW8221267.1 hypothetical protein [Bacteroidota bacterium]
AVFIGVFACDILRMTAGSAYSSYSGILAIGIWSLPPSIVVAYLLAVLTALGLQRQALPMMLILGIGSVAMNAILIPYLGMYGAVLARIIAPSIASVAGLWVLQSSAQGSSALLRLLFRSTICFAFLLTIQYALSVQSISAFLDVAAMRFVLWGSITSIGFAVSTITTGMLTRSDILRARALLSMSTSSNSLT